MESFGIIKEDTYSIAAGQTRSLFVGKVTWINWSQGYVGAFKVFEENRMIIRIKTLDKNPE